MLLFSILYSKRWSLHVNFILCIEDGREVSSFCKIDDFFIHCMLSIFYTIRAREPRCDVAFGWLCINSFCRVTKDWFWNSNIRIPMIQYLIAVSHSRLHFYDVINQLVLNRFMGSNPLTYDLFHMASWSFHPNIIQQS